MKLSKHLKFCQAGIVAWFSSAGLVKADVIYSGLNNTTIPADFTGVQIDVDGLNGWDLNPFFGGVGVANTDLFQPARTGTGNLDTLQNLPVGGTIGAGSLFSTGYGGSQNHLGSTFTAGTDGYIGFKLNGNYGWIRVQFTANTAGAVVRDWAYDTSGAPVNVGRIQQSAPVAGTQTVTLSPGVGETFALGSALTNTGGNTNSLIKTGGGTTTLNGANTFSGTTTISAGTLRLGGANALQNTSGISSTGGSLTLSGVGDRINNSAPLTLSGGSLSSSGLSEAMGALTVGGGGGTTSVIDLATGNSLLTFESAGSTAWSGDLEIWNWTGTRGQGGGTDRLLFSSAAGNGNINLANVEFFSDNGTTSLGTGMLVNQGGFTELVAVPEPSVIFLELGIIGMVLHRRRRI
jgi:autotransporter-associated beta strand protein